MGYRMLLISIFPDRHLKLNFLLFFYRSKQLTDYIYRTYSVNYRSALDRLCVRMNIILLLVIWACQVDWSHAVCVHDLDVENF